MIDGKNFVDQPVRNNIKKHKNIKKLLLAQEMITRVVVY